MSKNFKLKELIASNTAKAHGISNIPSFDICVNLECLIDNFLQPLRDKYGKPIYVNSGYRCAVLNKAVGGVGNSHHLTGMAVDISVGSTDANKKLFEFIRTSGLAFTQLIDEAHYSWVHVSYDKNNLKRQVLHL